MSYLYPPSKRSGFNLDSIPSSVTELKVIAQIMLHNYITLVNSVVGGDGNTDTGFGR